MNPDILHQFLCLAEHGNYADAAQAWGTTPSGVSTGMRALEGNLGVFLVTQTNREVRLTRAGEKLKSMLGPYLEIATQLHEQVRAAGPVFLRLSIADGMDQAEVSAQIKTRDALESEPLVFMPTRASLAQQRAGLRRGIMDVGLSQTAASQDDADLVVEVAWREPLVAIFSEQHALTACRTLDPAMLSTHPVVVMGRGHDKQIAELLRGVDCPATLQTCKTLGEVFLAALGGSGVGLIGAWQWRAVRSMRGVTSRPVVDAQTGEPLRLLTYLRRPQTVAPGLENALAQLRRQLARVETTVGAIAG